MKFSEGVIQSLHTAIHEYLSIICPDAVAVCGALLTSHPPPGLCAAVQHTSLLATWNNQEKASDDRGKAPYVCDFPGCGMTFSRHYNLKRHQTVHYPGERKHECDVCGRCFERPYDLKVHRRSHEDDKPYACSICGKKFARTSTCRAHERTHQRSANITATNIAGSAVQMTPVWHDGHVDFIRDGHLYHVQPNGRIEEHEFLTPMAWTNVDIKCLSNGAPHEHPPREAAHAHAHGHDHEHHDLHFAPVDELHRETPPAADMMVITSTTDGSGSGHAHSHHGHHGHEHHHNPFHIHGNGGGGAGEHYHPPGEMHEDCEACGADLETPSEVSEYTQVSHALTEESAGQHCDPNEFGLLTDCHANSHVHGPFCGHPSVPHDGHMDYLVDDQLHHVHSGHCHSHGVLDFVALPTQQNQLESLAQVFFEH